MRVTKEGLLVRSPTRVESPNGRLLKPLQTAKSSLFRSHSRACGFRTVYKYHDTFLKIDDGETADECAKEGDTSGYELATQTASEVKVYNSLHHTHTQFFATMLEHGTLVYYSTKANKAFSATYAVFDRVAMKRYRPRWAYAIVDMIATYYRLTDLGEDGNQNWGMSIEGYPVIYDWGLPEAG